MLVVHSWSISEDLEDQSGIISEPFRYVSVARRGISEPLERVANTEIATWRAVLRSRNEVLEFLKPVQNHVNLAGRRGHVGRGNHDEALACLYNVKPNVSSALSPVGPVHIKPMDMYIGCCDMNSHPPHSAHHGPVRYGDLTCI